MELTIRVFLKIVPKRIFDKILVHTNKLQNVIILTIGCYRISTIDNKMEHILQFKYHLK